MKTRLIIYNLNRKLYYDRLQQWANAIIDIILSILNRKGPDSKVEMYYRSEWNMVNGMMRIIDFPRWRKEFFAALKDPDVVMAPDGNYGGDFYHHDFNEEGFH